MQELLDDQQVGQEEQNVPRVIYSLGMSYVAFWIATMLSKFELFDFVLVDFFAIFCLLLSFVTGIGAVMTLQQHWGTRLRGYGYFMVGSELILISCFIGAFWGYYTGSRTFDLLVLCILSAIGLFLAEYYKNRKSGAAWWPWIEQSMLWYLLLHVDKLLGVFTAVPFYGSVVWEVIQLILFWLGAGLFLWRERVNYTTVERQIGLLLYVSLGLMLSVLEINNSNSVFAELLLWLAIILLVLAIGKAQAITYNSEEQHE